jgi:hypothetical protein
LKMEAEQWPHSRRGWQLMARNQEIEISI